MLGGVARQGFRRNIRQLIRDHDPMFIVITETKVANTNMEDVVESLPFNSYVTIEPTGYSGGILILWNKGIHSFITVEKEPRALHGVIQVTSSTSFFLSIIYANTKHKGRLELWDKLITRSSNIDLPWLVLGDFNEITHQHEKIGGNQPKLYKMMAYRDTMDKCNLRDLGFVGNKFTWFNKRKNRPIFERLDRCWASPNWSLLYPNVVAHTLTRLSSDHNPILLSFNPTPPAPSQKYFKTENSCQLVC